MGEKVKISVIVPVYNTEEYLRECLNSVINQTLSDIEIICIDDGSTDNSLEILKEYQKADKRVIVLKNPVKGAGEARNFGLKHANGDFVLFFDADDYMKFNTLGNLYFNSVMTNSDITVCRSQNLQDETQEIIPIEYSIRDKYYNVPCIFNPKNEKYKNNIFQIFVGWPWDKLYKRTFIIENNLSFQNLRHSNDTKFVLLSLCCADNISILDENLIVHRRYPQSISSTREKAPECFYYALCELKEELEKRNLYEIFKQSYNNYCKSFARWHISTVNDKSAKKVMIHFYKKLLNIPENRKIVDEYDLGYLVSYAANKKFVFWGASMFLENILKEADLKVSNIIGIVDKDKSKWGKKIADYEIFSPEILKEKNVDAVLFTIQNNHENIYPKVKEEIEEKYSNIELLPNIFEEEV